VKSRAALTVVDSGGRLALRKLEAARALGLSDESFDRYVAPRVRCVRLGSVRLYPVAELAAFLDKTASLPVEGG
jgi:hypothetical protein